MSSIINASTRIATKHYEQVKEMTGATTIDMLWLMGANYHKNRASPNDPIKDPTASIILRFLLKYPEDMPLPEMPDYDSLFTLIDSVWDKNMCGAKFNRHRVSIMFGCTVISAYDWADGGKYSHITGCLMLILQNAIKREGRAGLDKFLKILRTEALSRGISENELWKKGWRPRKNDDENESVDNESRVMQKHINQVKDICGGTVFDMLWLYGSSQRIVKNDEKTPINDPTFSLILRYLMKYPEEFPLLKIPEYSEVEVMIGTYWDKDSTGFEFNTRRMSSLFGCSNIGAYDWSNGKKPSHIVQILWLIFYRAMSVSGRDGFTRCFNVVKEEARSRNIPDHSLWIDGWKAFGKKNKKEKKAA